MELSRVISSLWDQTKNCKVGNPFCERRHLQTQPRLVHSNLYQISMELNSSLRRLVIRCINLFYGNIVDLIICLFAVSISQRLSTLGDRIVENLMAAPMPASSEMPSAPSGSEENAPSLEQNVVEIGQAEQQAGPSGLQSREPHEVDGVTIPAGVDPSFLDALPEDIR